MIRENFYTMSYFGSKFPPNFYEPISNLTIKITCTAGIILGMMIWIKSDKLYDDLKNQKYVHHTNRVIRTAQKFFIEEKILRVAAKFFLANPMIALYCVGPLVGAMTFDGSHMTPFELNFCKFLSIVGMGYCALQREIIGD